MSKKCSSLGNKKKAGGSSNVARMEGERRWDHCPYDTEGVLWRARADKRSVLGDDDSSGVDSEGEDINERDFDKHYRRAVEGWLPLFDLTKRRRSRRTAVTSSRKTAPAPPAPPTRSQMEEDSETQPVLPHSRRGTEEGFFGGGGEFCSLRHSADGGSCWGGQGEPFKGLGPWHTGRPDGLPGIVPLLTAARGLLQP